MKGILVDFLRSPPAYLPEILISLCSLRPLRLPENLFQSLENRLFPDEPADCAKPGPLPGRIPIDSLFSPVRRVKYDVVNTRVGRRTDYDKPTLEIRPNGRLSPDEALTLSAAIHRHHLDVVVNFDIERKEAMQTLYSEIGAMYPDYELMIIPDVDVTD